MNSSDENKVFSELLRGALSSGQSGEVCARFEAGEASAYLEKALTRAEVNEFESHLAGCGICRQHLLELSKLAPISPDPPVVVSEVKTGWWQWLFSGWRLGLAGGFAATAAAVMIFVVTHRRPGTEQLAVRNEVSMPAQAPLTVTSPSPDLQSVASTAKAREVEKKAASPAVAAQAEKPAAPAADVKDAGRLEPRADIPSPPPPVVAAVPNLEGAGVVQAPDAERKMKVASAEALRDQSDQLMRNNSGRMVTGPMQNQANQVQPMQAEEMRQRQASKSEMARTVSTAKKVETRRAGGKRFTLVDGVWTDEELRDARGIATVSLKRDGDEMKKLVSEYPSLKEIFALGKVLVVWKGKVYKTLE